MKRTTIALIVFLVVVIVACVIAGIVVAVLHLRKPSVRLNFEPAPRESDNSLIWYKSSNADTYSYYIKKLDEFLLPYFKPRSPTTNIIQCENGTSPEPGSNKVCDVRVEHLIPCVSKQAYSYNSLLRGPCIFFTLDKDPDWIPEYYNFLNLPDEMPKYLKDHIKSLEYSYGANSKQLKKVWVSCDGNTTRDSKNVDQNQIKYKSGFGFDGAYFPVRNKQEYLNPIITIFFEKLTHTSTVEFYCKAWAKNIRHDKEEGIAHFKILKDYIG